MAFLRKRKPEIVAPPVVLAPTPTAGLRGTDGQAMWSCVEAVRIAGMKVDPRANS